jgi:curli biogenesis system outer membrane secretion channel CsgG
MKKTIASSLLLLFAASQTFALFGLGEDETETANEDFGLPPYDGVKHAIAVLSPKYTAVFTCPANFREQMAAMLESALYDTNRFVVVDRDRISDTIYEQDLQASGRAAAASDVAQTGLIRSARYLTEVEVTDLELAESGQEGGVSVMGFRIGGSAGQARVTTIVKVIDSTTGEIVGKERVIGKAGRKGLNVGYVGSNWGADLGGFSKTPLGEGAVVTVSGDRIIINRGANYSVPVGQKFVIREQGELLTDPTTGEVLERIEGKVISEIEITKVSDKISYARLVDGEMPEKGDVVVAAGA